MWMWPPRLAGDFAGAHGRDGLGGPGGLSRVVFAMFVSLFG
jgi:hypothetical protein